MLVSDTYQLLVLGVQSPVCRRVASAITIVRPGLKTLISDQPVDASTGQKVGALACVLVCIHQTTEWDTLGVDQLITQTPDRPVIVIGFDGVELPEQPKAFAVLNRRQSA